MLTNRHNLPAPLVNAIKNDPYTKGRSDISVTQLIQPPQIRRLLQGREVTEDASELIWRLLGSAVHAILERAYPDTAIVEKRLFAEVLGWIVSGQFDVYDNGILSDYKITSVYAYGKVKPEWENQLNLLAALCRKNQMPVRRLEIVAIFRDWRRYEALAHDYPEAQVAVIPVQLWTEEEAEAYMEERVRIHQLDTPPRCSDEERWMQPEKWALMKKGQKRAVKLFASSEALFDHAEKYGVLERKIDELVWAKTHYAEHRPGAYRRCEDYCAASNVCEQWRGHLESVRREPDGPSEQEDVADAAGLLETGAMAS